MGDETKMAFEFAKAGSEQLITLATGILGLSIAFTKDLVKRRFPATPWIFGSAWISYLLSIVSGVLHIWALTGSLEFPKVVNNRMIIQQNAKNFGMIQFFFFVLGTTLIIIYGIYSLKRVRLDEPRLLVTED